MARELPGYYFRLRENGATCFRVETQSREGRLELDPIAQVNIRNGEIRPQGDRTLSAADHAEIERWMAARSAQLARRARDETDRTLEALNATAQWAQSKASPEELEEVSDALLLAMHDLRNVLMRKKAGRIDGS